MKIRDAALGIYTHLEFVTCVTAFLPIMAASHLRHRGDVTQREPGRWMRRLGRTAGSLTPLWKFTIEGEPPPDIQRKAHVVVANHPSEADPFLLAWLPWDMRWVAKEELFKTPLIGWALTFGGDIALRRGDGSSVRTMMTECESAIAAGISIMIFPEGTRTRNDDAMRFRDGAFDLAIRTKAPLLPIAVAGTKDLRPKTAPWIARGHACAKILEPIPTENLTAEDLGALRDRSRDAITAVLPDLRARHGY
ncbi:1-acyl-sn-glycerol-3-phosphate acyltransferase [Pendulispora rubella]|uniref:1-acyl-sn-glycerol-3-phosphate acyltransferase n=1 Tax=Pendulispora rubella TaxID=2741070 RepID=A0ABZ2L3U7_9BACT